jgi:signal transduction histidine kinase
MIHRRSQTRGGALILLFSIALVVAVTWFAPALSAASLNMLFRLRGTFRAPDDIVIVAIDDQSLQRIGQWPWPRSVMAAAIDRLTEARPLSVGLDVIYAEPSAPADDRRLAEAIARNGRVVLPAQLYENSAGSGSDRSGKAAATGAASSTTAWLRPAPEFAATARGLGHAHVSPEVDGVVRGIQLSKADDRADRLWAFSLEVARVAEQIPEGDFEEQPGWLRFGPYRVPVRDEAAGSTIPGVTVIRPNEMAINYAGPAGSFRYFSLADLVDGRVAPSALAGKIALIGAVAESMGDARVTPFMHYSADRGQEMPGIEIHANIINTIRSRLSLRSLPDWAAFLAALAVILLSALVIKWFDGWRQIALLGLILFSIVAGSFLAFSRYLIILPLPAMLTGFAAVIPLLLNRALTASRELDLKLAALVSSQKGFLSAAAVGQDAILSHNQSRLGLPRNAEVGQDAILSHNQSRLGLPRSLAWKLRAVDDLTTRLLARMSFINRILSGMGEGVLVTDLAGRIVFANREATQLFGCGQSELIGAGFADFLIERGAIDRAGLRAAIAGSVSGRSSQLEFEILAPEPRYYSLLLSALDANADATADPDLLPAGGVIGVVVLFSDITKRVELDRMKTETLQLVSHELRTPLTSIQGLSDVLIKFPVEAGESREMLRTIHSEAVRLGEMINRYLDLTRLESGAQPLRLTQVSLEPLIAGCVRNLSLFAAERRVGLSARINPSLPSLRVDEQLLTQAVNNLLGNAIKYSPPETEVVIAAELNHANLMISVRDQGFGIPEEARERIFEKFYRLGRDAASEVVGAGLGLPLVKEIVERHGGRVTVESAPAAGSTFTIHLPLANADAHRVGSLAVNHQLDVNLSAARERARQSHVDLVEAGKTRRRTGEHRFAADAAD